MNNSEMKNILIIAGEVSGDLHAAALVKHLSSIDASLRFFGIGGDGMKASGVDIICHLDKMAFMGFAEVIRHLPFIKKVKRDVLSEVKKRQTKFAVLVDYPGFNLNIARRLKSKEIEIIYYISPQIWAWGGGRINKIRKLVKKMLVLFPFEEKLYRQNNVDAEFVGHPLIERLNSHSFLSKQELCRKFNLDESKEILLVLPGSRKHEISDIFPETIKAAERLANEFNFQVVVACSSNLDESLFDKFRVNFKFSLITGYTYDLLKHAKFGIIKSGTSTLEAGLMQLPMVIVYRTSGLTYRIGKALIRVKNIGMANILLEENVVPELVQSEVNTEKIYQVSEKILADSEFYNNIKAKLGQISSKLGDKNASANAARIIYNIIHEN